MGTGGNREGIRSRPKALIALLGSGNDLLKNPPRKIKIKKKYQIWDDKTLDFGWRWRGSNC